MPRYNARGCIFQIESTTPATWVEIGDINTFSKSHEEETTDTTTFGSAGQSESQKMQIGKSLTLEGLHNTTDPGQLRCEAVAELLGDASVIKFRFRAPAATTWEIWNAHANLGDQGGGNNDKGAWAVTFTRSGASTTAVVS
ncbi:phage tail tube protein [Streptomyces sp. NPDC056488]|uniref:phage tail tube protein n=1 Tax=Streptomyces sp. NPDC056488 TaxID=3345836 RepID=UPI00367634D8